ncbi:MAG: hypothetical protein ACOVOR_01555 [Rhabdochlamydiaceae bacterium]
MKKIIPFFFYSLTLFSVTPSIENSLSFVEQTPPSTKSTNTTSSEAEKNTLLPSVPAKVSDCERPKLPEAHPSNNETAPLPLQHGLLPKPGPQFKIKDPEEKQKDEEDSSSSDHKRSLPLGYHKMGILSGNIVKLSDESSWKIRESDLKIISGWHANHIVSLEPNLHYFSFYNYILTNHMTKQTVFVDLNTPPLECFRFLDVILRLPFQVYIDLSEGPVWESEPQDFDTIKKWRLNDRIIIGRTSYYINDDYSTILINLDQKSHVYARKNIALVFDK